MRSIVVRRQRNASTPARAGLRAFMCFVVVCLVVGALLPLKRWLVHAAPNWTGERVLDVELAYQLLTWPLAAALIFIGRRLGAPGRFLAFGEANARARALPLLGVKEGEPWRLVLRNFAFLSTGVTALVVYLQVAQSSSALAPHLLKACLLSLPFAASNAAVEEGVFRVALLEATVGALGGARAAWLSGALFGGIHYFGVPGALPGVAMAGFLGFVLARAVVETRGVFGAWLIHFLQDVVIFTMCFAVAFAAPSAS